MKRIKSLVSLALCFCLLFGFSVFTKAENLKKDELSLDCKGAVLMDMRSGEVLYSKDENEKVSPASITKVMTSICMLDFVYDINTKFTIKTLDITSGSGPSLNNGDIMTYKEGLHAMLLPSSNTTAEAVATSVGHIMYSYDNK